MLLEPTLFGAGARCHLLTFAGVEAGLVAQPETPEGSPMADVQSGVLSHCHSRAWPCGCNCTGYWEGFSQEAAHVG